MINISDKDKDLVIEWLLSGDTGISSECLACEFLGKQKNDGWGWRAPSDPADLGRCLRLIDKVPEIRKCVDSLALKNDSWKKIAGVWDEITESMINEVGIHWEKASRAPITFKIMQAALYPKN